MHSVRLVSVTPKAEELIAYCARVSNPSNQNNPDAERLIRYLIKHNHWSPFELAHVVMEIETTRSISAQILRHRSFSFQEFSQRYADVELMSFAKAPALRRQDKKNRQNSINDLSDDVVFPLQVKAQLLMDQTAQLYKEMLEAGVAKECARGILPLDTPTRLYMSGTVRSWLHYCDLRCANGTQLEHQKIAEGARQILRECLPSVSAAYFN